MRVTGVLTQRISMARQAAFQVLKAVENGAYASDTLRQVTAGLAPRDAGLAGQIVFGSLRFQLQLDHVIQMYSGRRASDLDAEVAIALRIAMFQLRYLERVPSHAAVHESVELVKAHRRAAAGFCNAVLRKVNRNPVEWPDRATRLSCPEWLLRRWDKHFGPAAADAIALAALGQPQEYIRIPPGGSPPAGMAVAATAVPGAYRIVESSGRGTFRLHDISSQAIVPMADLKPGQTYLDLCAAPGNKTAQALETRLRLAVACDISERRLRMLEPMCPRVVLDGTAPLPFPPATFDRIFIDAPCSGTGTMGRNPEIKWRVQPHDLREFGVRQAKLIAQALQVLAPGGKLLYATCSLETEENEDVVRRIVAEHPQVQVERELWRIPGHDAGDGFYAALLASDGGSREGRNP